MKFQIKIDRNIGKKIVEQAEKALSRKTGRKVKGTAADERKIQQLFDKLGK